MRGFLILRSRRWFFFCGWPPVVCFFIETATAFFFRLLFASIIKNRPVRGGFFLQLDLCGPNSKLCRWYRTFFEILLRISAFFALVRCKFLWNLAHCIGSTAKCTAWKLLSKRNMVSSVKNVFLRRRAVGAQYLCAGRFASASKLLFFRNGEIPG